MEISPAAANNVQLNDTSNNKAADQVSPQKAVQELQEDKQQNVNMQFGIEALKQSVQNDPVAQILNILV